MVAARALLALMVLVPVAAQAKPHTAIENTVDDGDDAERGTYSRMSLTLGLFTPTGEIGFEYTAVFPYLEVGAGVGFGGLGPQASIMPRLHIGTRHTSATLGVGFSGGIFHDASWCITEDADRCRDSTTAFLWANVEVGVAWSSDGGATVRLYGGLGRLLDPQVVDVELPYFGLAIGHTL